MSRPGLALALASLLITTVGAAPSLAKPGDNLADAAWGQADLVHNAPDFLFSWGLNAPGAAAVDSVSGPGHVHVYVVDTANNRVLAFQDASSLQNGVTASLVFGQPDFRSAACNNGTLPSDAQGLGPDGLCHPTAVAVDNVGNLYIADTGNNRVLEFNVPFNQGIAAGMPANAVFGQNGGFESKSCSGGATGLCQPSGVATDSSGNLYVGDTGNNRVLEFNTPLTNTTANVVLGQPDFTHNACNGGATPSATTLCGPTGLSLDTSKNLYVADTLNNRALKYNAPLADGAAANVVLGQADFVHNACNGGSTPSATTLCAPSGVGLDSSNNFYVADSANNRVLKYTAGFGDGAAATLVYGQNTSTDFTDKFCNGSSGVPSATTLCAPNGLGLDTANNQLYVADTSNNRLLRYPLPSVTANLVLGQADFAHDSPNNLNAFGLDRPGAVALDMSIKMFHLYVADTANSRVLGWANAQRALSGLPADLVIGQPDFRSGGCNDGTASGDIQGLGPDSLCSPSAVAVDARGNLYVADSKNNRVLEYPNPFMGCKSSCIGPKAKLVFGQNGVFTASTCATGAGGLCNPAGVAVDSLGNLFVGDSGNNRVLEYNTPLTKTKTPGSGDTTADLAFGQAGSTDFSDKFCNGSTSTPSAMTLCGPSGVALDAGNHLYVGDTLNNRVLEYNTPLSSVAADLAIGQVDFAHNACNGSSAPSASTLCGPTGVALDVSNNLYVADTTNNRLLEFNTPLNPTSGETGAGDGVADIAFGNLLSTAQCNGGTAAGDVRGVGPDSLCAPSGVAVDRAGNVFVADSTNNRALVYLGAAPFAPLFVTKPLSLSFPKTIALSSGTGATSKALNVTISNPKTTQQNVSIQSFAFQTQGDFAISKNTCGSTLKAGGQCTVSVTFSPTQPGLRAGALVISAGAGNSPVSVALSGVGVAARLGLSIKSLRFNTQKVGVQDAPKTLSVSNPNPVGIAISGAAITGTDLLDFVITSNNCTTLAPNKSCKIGVAFKPQAKGTRTASLTLTDNVPPGQQNVPLTGVGK